MATPKIRWTKVNDSGLIPKPRHGHRAIGIRELMIVFGGGNEGIIDELHAYNTDTNQWFVPVVKGDIPCGAAAFGLAADNSRLVFFGGMIEFGNYSNSVYELQVGPYFTSGSISSKWEWKSLRPKPPRFAPSPSPRLGHSLTFIGGKYYSFGGLSKEALSENDLLKDAMPIKYLNELYILEFKGNSCHWEMPHTYGRAPSPRESHTAVGHTDSLGNPKLLIYGGMAGFRHSDVHILDINSMTWSQPQIEGPHPLARSLHTSSVIGDKMYVFGGWVPVKDNGDIYEREWRCTDTLGRLNLNTYQWEMVELSHPEDRPRPRAGHSAVVVGARVYIWSGRDGYARAWNSQICYRDLWYLEVGKPDHCPKVQLVKAGTNMLELCWPDIQYCDHYVLQIMKYAITPPPKPPVNKKRKIAEAESPSQDTSCGPIRLTPPVPVFPMISNEEPLSALKEEILPSLLMEPPNPLTITAAYPVTSPRINPPIPQHPPLLLQQPIMSEPELPTVSSKVPLDSNVKMRIRNSPGVVTSKVYKEQVISLPRMVLNTAGTPPPPLVGTMQPSETVVQVNSGLGGSVRFHPPPKQPQEKFIRHELFHNVPQPNVSHKQQTIVISKPISRVPAQQFVVVSSAPAQRPAHTVQTMAQSGFNHSIPKQVKVSCGNAIKTLTIQGKTQISAPSQIQTALKNPMASFKNVKLQVGGKTVTMVMPMASTSVATPMPNISGNKFVCYQQNASSTNSSNMSQPRVAPRQELMHVQQQMHKSIKIHSSKGNALRSPNATHVRLTKEPEIKDTLEENAEKRIPVQQSKDVGIICEASKYTGLVKSPKVILDETKVHRETKEVLNDNVEQENELELAEPVELPAPPSNIKIAKTSDGAIISWTPPVKGAPVTGYSVNLGVRVTSADMSNKIHFVNIFNDVQTETKISQALLDKATLKLPRPTIIFRISARNLLGFGPATQVRWLQDSKTSVNHSNEGGLVPMQSCSPQL